MTICKKNLNMDLIREILLCRAFGIKRMDLAITISNKKFGSTTLILRPIKVGMLNFFLPDLVKFYV